MIFEFGSKMIDLSKVASIEDLTYKIKESPAIDGSVDASLIPDELQFKVLKVISDHPHFLDEVIILGDEARRFLKEFDLFRRVK